MIHGGVPTIWMVWETYIKRPRRERARLHNMYDLCADITLTSLKIAEIVFIRFVANVASEHKRPQLCFGARSVSPLPESFHQTTNLMGSKPRSVSQLESTLKVGQTRLDRFMSPGHQIHNLQMNIAKVRLREMFLGCSSLEKRPGFLVHRPEKKADVWRVHLKFHKYEKKRL